MNRENRRARRAMMTKPMTMTKHPHRPRAKAVLSNTFLSHLSFLLLLLYAYRDAMRYGPRGRKPREELLSQKQMQMKPETRHFEDKLHPGPKRRVRPKPKKEGGGEKRRGGPVSARTSPLDMPSEIVIDGSRLIKRK